MKKFLILFLMSLSLVACGSGGSDDGNNDDGGGGGGGVVKPTSISASPMVATVGVQTQVTFTFEPPESIDSCTAISLQGCNTVNSVPDNSGFTFTPVAAGFCDIAFTCDGDLYTIDIQVIQ